MSFLRRYGYGREEERVRKGRKGKRTAASPLKGLRGTSNPSSLELPSMALSGIPSS